MQTDENSSVLFHLQTYTPSTVIFNLADADTVDSAAEEILRCYGQVDVLINNAGISYRGNILETHLSVQREVMETNYFGTIALTQGEWGFVARCEQSWCKNKYMSESNYREVI